MPKKGIKNGETFARQQEAWRLHLLGWPQQRIADKLELTQQAISSILKTLRAQYHKEFMKDIDEVVQSQVAILQDMFLQSRDSWELSKAVGPYGEHPNNQFGDIKYLNACASYMADIRKILGADAPIKFDLEFDASKYSLDDLRRIAEAKSPSELIASGILGK